MNETELDAFKSYLQAKVAQWHEEIKCLGSFDEGEWVAASIMQDYVLQKRGIYPPFIMILEDHSMPYCEGCSNQFGWCGTPCTVCEKSREFDGLYQPFLRMKGFTIYEKKSYV